MKRIVCMVLILVLVLAASFSSVYGATDSMYECAEALHSLGLFKGSDTGYDLDSNATRVQISVTLIRLLGKEAKAEMQENPHPFTDVPAWANNSIGWLYENYLVNGISDTWFDADAIANRQQFVTMLLRALGYSDTGGRDFTYDNALYFAKSIGLTNNTQNAVLTRGEMVSLAYTALGTPLRNARRTLAEKLCAERIFTREAAISTGVMKGEDYCAQFADIPENLGAMDVSRDRVGFILTFDNPPESYGMRLFCSVDGGPYTQVTEDTAISCEEQIIYRNGDSATYLRGYKIYGMYSGRVYSFIALKTSSTGAIYTTYGKTKVLRMEF